MTTQLQVLYEKIMQDLSVSIKMQLNEAYENQLLEEYGARDLFNDIIDETSKDSKILYKQIRKFLIYVIEKLLETDQYKKAEKIMAEYKKRVEAYIEEHKKMTPKRMLKIIITVLTIYGGVSLVQDCRSLINTLEHNVNNTEQVVLQDTTSIDTLDAPEEFDVDPTLSAKENVNKEDINSAVLPSTMFKNDKDYKFLASNKAAEFIKSHEFLLLYPYYANSAEEREGKVTIGYGHVVLPSDGALYDKILKLKKKGLITQSYIYTKKKGLILNPTHCKNIITLKEADNLFKGDLKIAENRAFNAIKSMNTDENVKCYMLYNQNIIDGLTSLCYNAGNLKLDKYSFITNGLAKCNYDYDNNCINKGDYNVSFSKFKNIKDNPDRRAEEYYKFFVNANTPINVRS